MTLAVALVAGLAAHGARLYLSDPTRGRVTVWEIPAP